MMCHQKKRGQKGMKTAKTICIAAACAILLVQAGCVLTRHPSAANKVETRSAPLHHEVRSLNAPTDGDEARIPLTRIGQTSYFPLHDLLRIIGYQSAEGTREQQLLIGSLDPVYEIAAGSKQARKEERNLTLSAAPIMKDRQLLVPLTVLSDLFEQDLHYRVEPDGIVVQAVPGHPANLDEMDAKLTARSTSASEAFFADAPHSELGHGGPVALSAVDMNALIRTAKQYIGTPYLFGAAPYPKSRKFDCSSFTQYVFGKYGIKLNRVARSQATQGTPVSRQALRKGDLVFFAVPGRFSSDKIVGHVGIYIGDGKMINTYSDKKGVHIAAINEGYWSTQYLSARRISA